ncbi:MAG: dTMP kinase [Chlorobi bacterium]|nr:dTMP kinase [Chlorobiota bacterium]
MFITFEGLDFSGKSTQIFLLRERLEKAGHKVVVIREPGGTPISEKVRNILLDKKNQEMVFETELLLFSASRAQLVREVILPHLKKNHFVLSDRFHDSSVAYQGFGRGVDIETLMEIQRFAIGDAVPDLTFFIDIPLEMIESRKIKHNAELDRIELMKSDFYIKVREGYLFLAEKEKRFRVIDGTKSKEEVHKEIMKYIEMFESGKEK